MRRPSPTSAKRWTLKIALCLLAGAVITWGVAWGCALWSPTKWRATERFTGAAAIDVARTLGYGRALDLADPSLSIGSVSGFGVCLRISVVRVPSFDIVSSSGDLLAGWPSYALFYRMNDDAPRAVGDFDIPRWLQPIVGDTTLPAAILPLGFALNTLFYAAVLLGVVECVAIARRRARWRKGRCPSCGYDRAGLAEGSACPECGGNGRSNG